VVERHAGARVGATECLPIGRHLLTTEQSPIESRPCVLRLGHAQLPSISATTAGACQFALIRQMKCNQRFPAAMGDLRLDVDVRESVRRSGAAIND